MAKYNISGYLTISAFAVVEADSEEEARAKAEQLATPSLCHQCADAGGGDDTWQLNGFDDPPEDAVQYVELDECVLPFGHAGECKPVSPPNDPITGYCSLHNELEPCDSCASPAPAPASPSVEPERELTRDECWEAYLRTKEAFIRLGESRDALKARLEELEAKSPRVDCEPDQCHKYQAELIEERDTLKARVEELERWAERRTEIWKGRHQQLEAELSETQSLLLAATNQRDEARGQLADEKAAHLVVATKHDRLLKSSTSQFNKLQRVRREVRRLNAVVRLGRLLMQKEKEDRAKYGEFIRHNLDVQESRANDYRDKLAFAEQSLTALRKESEARISALEAETMTLTSERDTARMTQEELKRKLEDAEHRASDGWASSRLEQTGRIEATAKATNWEALYNQVLIDCGNIDAQLRKRDAAVEAARAFVDAPPSHAASFHYASLVEALSALDQPSEPAACAPLAPTPLHGEDRDLAGLQDAADAARERDIAREVCKHLLTMYWLYPNYRVDSRGPVGLIRKVTALLWPELDAYIEAHHFDPAREKFFPDNETEVEPEPPPVADSSGADSSDAPMEPTPSGEREIKVGSIWKGPFRWSRVVAVNGQMTVDVRGHNHGDDALTIHWDRAAFLAEHTWVSDPPSSPEPVGET